MGLVIRPVADLVNLMTAQLYQAPKDTIPGIDASRWPSPLQPVKPIGPEGTEPKAFQFFEGQNLLWTPRPDAFYSAAQLKQLAQYPLASICISNVKDVICKAPWEIQVKLMPGETRRDAAKRARGDKEILRLSRFFEKPDRRNTWDSWLRPLLDDMLVIDAATILVRKNFKGEVVELPVLRGEAISCYIDNNGWTPQPPYPAYAQNWWGIPLVNLTTDQLIYRPRNIVPRNTISSQLYGMSPTEQLAPEIEIGVQRLAFVLAYYTEGSVPGLMQVVPKGTSTDKIAEAMGWMNSELAGNLAARRQIRLIQGWQEPGKLDQIVMTKEPLLADAYDEQHTKRVAFGYGVSPQRLSKQANRASAEQQDEAVELEGTMPYFAWLKHSIMDYIIQHVFGLDDYEWVPDPFREPSFDRAAEAVNKIMSKPVMTINEVRDRLGLEPRPEPTAEELGMATANGWLPLDVAIKVATLQAGGGDNANSDPAPGNKKDDKAPSNGKTAAAVARVAAAVPVVDPGVKAKTNFGFGSVIDAVTDPISGSFPIASESFTFSTPVSKASALDTRRAVISSSRSLPQTIKARHHFEKMLQLYFKQMNRIAVKTISAKLVDMSKAADDQSSLAAQLREKLKEVWEALVAQIIPDYAESGIAGVNQGAAQLESDDEELMSKVDQLVGQRARDRAAELVSLKWTEDGSLVENPDAKFSVAEVTETKLAEAVTVLLGLKQPTTLNQVVSAIDEVKVFSDARAELIAKNETRVQQASANLLFWKESGEVREVDWVLSEAHDQDDLCDALAIGSPYHIDDVPEFPAHPNCLCSLVLRKLKGEK